MSGIESENELTFFDISPTFFIFLFISRSAGLDHPVTFYLMNLFLTKKIMKIAQTLSFKMTPKPS